MSDTNIVVFTGHLRGDVDLRYFPQSGDPIAELSVAINKHRFNQQTNEYDTDTTWAFVKMHGKLAERAHEKLSKSAKVLIEGELSEDDWIDKKTKKKRSKLFVTGTSFKYLSGGTKSTQKTGQDASYHQQ